MRVVTETWPPRLRSALFVPGHRARFFEKAASSEADALILDLEDAVTDRTREAARQQIDAATAAGWTSGPRLCVRVNSAAAGTLEQDLRAAVGPGLLAVVLPKARGSEDIAVVDRALGECERRAGLAPGTVRIWPLVENAQAVQNAAELATASPRIAYMGGGTARGGDLAASLGFEWTPEGLETLFLRSKILVDVRAAGVPHPVTGMVTDLGDPEQLRAFATSSKQLGYEGMMIIHPSHVEAVNEIFGTSRADREQALAILTALRAGEAAGNGAVTVNGRMVDTAMRTTAERLLSSRSGAGAGTGE